MVNTFDITPFDDVFTYFKKGVGAFDNNRKDENEQFFKVYNDGGHYVGRIVATSRCNVNHYKETELDSFFDYVYFKIGRAHV